MKSKKLESNRLSSGRKATNRMRQMRQTLMYGFLMVTGILIFSCQENGKGQNLENKNLSASVDSLHKPKVNIKVNRRYDDKGNLIGMDSTYSSYYSNIEGDTTMMDSLFNSFGHFFNQNHSSFFENDLNTLFFDDSVRYNDFFHDDFFLKRYQSNDEYLKEMMQRMDSIKNKFYEEQRKERDKTADL